MLILEGKAPKVVHEFEKVIDKMPAKFQIKITDTFESKASAGVFVRMTWEVYARLLSTVDMKPLLPVVGPSRIRAQLLLEGTYPSFGYLVSLADDQ